MSEEKFRYWKELVGMEDGDRFPHLNLKPENIQSASISPTQVQRIQNEVMTNKFVDVQVQPGWGATTLYYYMVHTFEFLPLKLLILFDFEKDGFQGGDFSEQTFIFQVKWKMAYGIVNIMLQQPLQEYLMYEVFAFEDTGEIPWRVHLRMMRRKLQQCENDVEFFYQNFPFFSENDIASCLDYFLRSFQIQTIFMYLFPRKTDEDNILDFIGTIKNIFDGKDIAPAALREVYFITNQMFLKIKHAYERPYKDVMYPRYSSAEIFGMLVNTYKLQDVTNATISDLFDPKFISKVYDKKDTLEGIMRKVENEIIDFLSNVQEVPYKLRLIDLEANKQEDEEN